MNSGDSFFTLSSLTNSTKMGHASFSTTQRLSLFWRESRWMWQKKRCQTVLVNSLPYWLMMPTRKLVELLLLLGLPVQQPQRVSNHHTHTVLVRSLL